MQAFFGKTVGIFLPKMWKFGYFFPGIMWKPIFFHKKFSAISSSGHLNCGFHKPAVESLSPKNRKWFKGKIWKRWIEFKKYFWTCWMQFWEPFQKIFTKRRRIFGPYSEKRIELYWFQKNHFSSNVPLDTEVAILRTLPFFLHNAENCYRKIRGRFLFCFLSNRLSFLKISSGQLICILSPTDKF